MLFTVILDKISEAKFGKINSERDNFSQDSLSTEEKSSMSMSRKNSSKEDQSELLDKKRGREGDRSVLKEDSNRRKLSIEKKDGKTFIKKNRTKIELSVRKALN